MAGNFWQSSHYEQWMLEKADLLRQRADDLRIYTDDEYQKLMIFFCNFIQTIATDTSQNQAKTRMQVIATACVYFKRFYARRSFKDMDPFLLAPTCIFLASKVEEHGMMSTSKLMTSVSSTLKKLNVGVEQPSMRVGYIHEAEFILLEILDCCLVVFHPYRPLTHMMQDLGKDPSIKDLPELEAQAWKVCNDSLRCDVSLLYPPHMISIACIMLAALLLNREKDIRNWMSEMAVDFEKVNEIVQQLMSLYRVWKTFDEKEQLKPLLDRMPKANPSPTQPPQQSSQQPQFGMGI